MFSHRMALDPGQNQSQIKTWTLSYSHMGVILFHLMVAHRTSLKTNMAATN